MCSSTPSLETSLVLKDSGSSSTSPSRFPRMFVEYQPCSPSRRALNPGASRVFMKVCPVLKSFPPIGAPFAFARSMRAGTSAEGLGAPFASGVPAWMAAVGVPAAGDRVLGGSRRDEVRDVRVAPIRALAQPHRPHLGQAADGPRQPPADRLHSRDEGGGHRSHPRQEHSQPALGRGDGPALSAGHRPFCHRPPTLSLPTAGGKPCRSSGSASHLPPPSAHPHNHES